MCKPAKKTCLAQKCWLARLLGHHKTALAYCESATKNPLPQWTRPPNLVQFKLKIEYGQNAKAPQDTVIKVGSTTIRQ